MTSRTTIVTGGSGSIGSAISKAFAQEGSRVFVGYHKNGETASTVVSEIRSQGGSAEVLRLDLGDPHSVRASVGKVCENETVGILVNNAAIRPNGAFTDLDDETWNDVIQTNLMGAVRCARLVIPGMASQGFGRIINISSTEAEWGWGGRAHVTTSKAAVGGLTRSLAAEYALDGITANTILPGSIATVRNPTFFPEWESLNRYLLERTPLRRQGAPAEIAAACVYLASDQAGYVTGQDLHVNGGSFPLLVNPAVRK